MIADNTCGKVGMKTRNITDVLVIGGGPAGFGASVTASRAGAKVTLVEYGGMLGGMWTLGILSPFFDNEGKDGLNRELREKLKELNAWGGLWDISFDHVQMAMILDEYITDCKIDLLLFTTAVEAVVEHNVIKGVVVANKSGLQTIYADVIIDCTGDGDIAARAGNPYEAGRAPDGMMQPMTMMFKIGGLSEKYPYHHLRTWYDELLKRIPEEKVIESVPFNNPALIHLPRKGEALIEWTHVFRSRGTNGDELTAAALEGRRQVRNAMRCFESVKDVLGEVYLLDLPMVIGVRETRRITGEYIVSDNDVKSGRKHDDGICRVMFNVDIHDPGSEKQTCIKHPGFDIPYRALVPSKIDNLLVAGRCISGSHTAHAAYRVTGDCLATGEAAGYAAAEAVRTHSAVRSIDGTELARKLEVFRAGHVMNTSA